MDKDYGEIFCQAVDTIVGEKLKGISFDQTVVCSIEDDSRRAEGVYAVSDGSVKFEAYSDNTGYRTGNEVYVSIPQGDWAQQKFIIGKKTNKDNQKYIYSTPFSTFLDMTGNVLVSQNYEITDDKIGALVTNDTSEERILVKKIDFTKNGEELYQAGYNRLGVKADFRSWLRDFGVIEGNYGIQLLIHCENNEVGQVDGSESNVIIAELDCSEMTGNSYTFNTYYEQEKVFDISNYPSIKSIEIYFYQKSNFKDKEGKIISPLDAFGNLLSPNLFIQSPYISFGYDISQFEKDITIVFSHDKLTYSATNDNNQKGLMLRWIRNVDGTISPVNEKNDLPVGTQINWYRYELGSPSADKYSGVYWKYLATYSYDYQYNKVDIASEEDYNKKPLYRFDKDDGIYKIASAYSEEEIYYEKGEVPEHIFTPYTENGLASEEEDNPLSIAFNPDVTLQDEKIKAIIYCNGSRFYSNILIFENEREVVSKPTVDAIQALSLNCDDGTYGNYKIYNHDNSLIDSAQSYKDRKLTAVFSSRLTGNTEGGTGEYKINAESITWYIPAENTMIKFDADPNLLPENGYYKVYRKKGEDNKVDSQLLYRIKSQYSHANSNNIIKCELDKDNTTYTAIKEFTFGQAGTTGTEATLILDFTDSNRNAMTIGDAEVVEIKAFLYDYENNLIDLSTKTGLTYNWKWKDKTDSGFVSINNILDENGNATYTTQLQLIDGNIDLSQNFHILELKIEGWGDYDLYGYLPIPIRTEAKYTHITGATSILYDTSGTLVDYYKNPYILHGVDTQPNWSLNGEDVGDKYGPQLNNNSLIPLNFYIKDSNRTLNVYCDYWSQPILVLQNRYFNKQVNDWNGELMLDEENNIIMSAQIAAGSKDGDNQFSGVILGSWKKNNTAEEATSGLYGYNKGSQSFGFREDGTAFIGKTGAGRIVFDGNKSTISSTAYENNEGGLALDLINGKITMISPKNPEKSGTITFDSTARRTPFNIGTNFSVDWDGTIKATNGEFKGSIEADEGYIGGWAIDENSISRGEVTLSASRTNGRLEIGDILIDRASSGNYYICSDPSGLPEDIESAQWGMSGGNEGLCFYAGYNPSKPANDEDSYNFIVNNDGDVYCTNLYVKGKDSQKYKRLVSTDDIEEYIDTYTYGDICYWLDNYWEKFIDIYDKIYDLEDEIASLKK